MSQGKITDHMTLYKAIAAEIIRFHWKPGDLIPETEIAVRFGASRALVHNVLKHLEDHRLLHTVPRAGCVISRLNMNEINQMIYERFAVETMVLKDFIACRSGEDVRNVSALYDALRDSVKNYRTAGFEPERFMRADQAMHAYWFGRMRLEMIWEELSRWQASYTRFCMLDISAGDNADTVVAEHGEMLGMIEKGRSDGLEDLMRRHLYGCVRRIGPLTYTTLQPYFEPITEDMETPRA